MMRLDVAAAVPRSGAFMPIKSASAYLLAHGESPQAEAAARTALDIAHLGFKDMRTKPHVDESRARLDALATLFMGTLAANSVLNKARQSEGVSFAGVAVRGTMLCLVRAGSAHAHRLDRRSLTELVPPATSAPCAPLGLVPSGPGGEAFTAAWEQGDVLLLSCGSLVTAVEPKVIARAVLETADLTAAAREIAAMAKDSASLALVRWA